MDREEIGEGRGNRGDERGERGEGRGETRARKRVREMGEESG